VKTRDYYTTEAEHLLDRAHHYTYGDGADPVTGGALAAEAQAYALLATAAPVDTAAVDELVALRSAVAALLHDADTTADHQLRDVLTHHRAVLADTPHGAPVLTLLGELAAAMAGDLTQADAAALDAVADVEFAQDTEGQL
jgi:hypothetical protein